MTDTTWPSFTVRLTDVLAELATREREVVLIIADQGEPACFVQYLCGGDFDGIWAEVASNKFLPKHRQLTKKDEKWLRSEGWDPPGGSGWIRQSGLPNWSCDRFLNPGADHRRLSEMTVTALHQILGVGSPSQLAHKAFVQATGEPVVLDRLGLPSQTD